MFQKNTKERDRPPAANYKRKDDDPGQRGWRMGKYTSLRQGN